VQRFEGCPGQKVVAGGGVGLVMVVVKMAR
jgi:hypothetical protein